MRIRISAWALVFGMLAAPQAWATNYEIDQAHSTVGFSIRHLFSKTQGWFRQVQGTFVYVAGQPDQWTAEATMQVESIDTNVADRDKHLRSADFFDVEKFPTLTFKSTQVTDVDGNKAKLHGVLTMRGIEKPVILDLVAHGEGKDPWGNQRSGFTATGKLSRKDFGLEWNKALETGEFLVGDEVEITLEIEGIAK